MTRARKDLGASVRERLLRLAQERGEDFQLVLLRYANERLLYRLATSRHASRFVLKGAALFTLWTGRAHRATRDVDLLGSGAPGETHGIFAELLAADVAPDGVVFEAGTLRSGPIREAQAYSGIRVTLQAPDAAAGGTALRAHTGVSRRLCEENAVDGVPPEVGGNGSGDAGRGGRRDRRLRGEAARRCGTCPTATTCAIQAIPASCWMQSRHSRFLT